MNIKNNGLINIVISIWGVLISYGFSIIFLNKIGIEEYGSYNLFITYATIISLFLGLGMPELLIRDSYLKENTKKNNTIELLLTSVILCTILFSIIFLLLKDKNIYFFNNKLLFLLLFLQTICLIIEKLIYSYLISIKKSTSITFLGKVFFKIEVLITLFISITYYNNSLITIFIFKIIFELLTIICLLNHENFFINLRNFKLKYYFFDKNNFKYSIYLMLHKVTELGVFNIDKLLIAKLLNLKDLGGYSFSLSLSGLLMIISTSIRNSKLAMFSKFIKNKDKESLNKLYKDTQHIMVYLALPLIVTIISYSKEILYIFNKDLINYNMILIFLSLSSFSNIFFGFNGTIINMSYYYKFQFYSKIIFLMLITLSDIYLIKRYGINGAAIATFICFTLYNLLKTLLVYAKEKITPFSKETLRQIIYLVLIIYINTRLNIKANNIFIIGIIVLMQYLILYFVMTSKTKKILHNFFSN